MRQFERRKLGKPVYYKLAHWDASYVHFTDGKRQFDSESEAKASAKKPGRYRISRIEENGRIDLEPFEVTL